MDYNLRIIKGNTHFLLKAEDNDEKTFLYYLEKQVIDNGKHLEFVSSTRVGNEKRIDTLELMVVD